MLGVDIGGTFTDVVAVRDGRITVTKVASLPSNPADPVVEGARRLGVEGSTLFNHASTAGLNAVITRQLPKVAFLGTDGFRDILTKARLWRPLDAQTDASWRRSFGDSGRPLIPRYLRRGVIERVLADGTVMTALDEDQARRQLEVLGRCAVEGIAICLLNSYVNRRHEERLRELTQEVLGDVPVSISAETSPLAKEYARASTAVIDVMMKLMFTSYAGELDERLRELGFGGALNFADCAATLMPWRDALEQPFRIVFAGPAAGTTSSARLGEALGERELICCDVGGTSTDVSLVQGGRPFVNDTFSLEHDLIINALSTEISSVGAGGGSIVSISATGDVLVGPQSAGADPGPACYGRGGEAPTITDACLLMGILDPDGFAGGEMHLDAARSLAAFEALESRLDVHERIAYAYRIAVHNIAEEVTNVAVRHGVDLRDFALVAYGAAGPMLLPAALEQLRVKRIVIPPHPGLFSALGLLSTDLVYYDSQSAYMLLMPDAAPRIAEMFEAMEARLRSRVAAGADGVVVARSFDGRLYGQSWETPLVAVEDGPITAATVAAMIASFHEEYERRYGNRFEAVPVQGVTYRVQLIVPIDKVDFSSVPEGSSAGEPARQRIRTLSYFEAEPLEAPEYDRATLGAGAQVAGPAIISEGLSTTLVCPGQLATVGRLGEISIEAVSGA
ncbi:MAG TPA: hydantoinase/oxoprolinase family protein [Solirubrobacteraceae bacterium]|nr:hydantoinase/oxoprolinase family protein [Solirubrobacteraceae bacterium]